VHKSILKKKKKKALDCDLFELQKLKVNHTAYEWNPQIFGFETKHASRSVEIK
jgi:hypothetical protein